MIDYLKKVRIFEFFEIENVLDLNFETQVLLKTYFYKRPTLRSYIVPEHNTVTKESDNAGPQLRDKPAARLRWESAACQRGR